MLWTTHRHRIGYNTNDQEGAAKLGENNRRHNGQFIPMKILEFASSGRQVY